MERSAADEKLQQWEVIVAELEAIGKQADPGKLAEIRAIQTHEGPRADARARLRAVQCAIRTGELFGGDKGQAPAALCLSGGGIRSATFNLGVLQGLAKCGLLKEFDYLSTVSGGGYVGSWLTAWLHHERERSGEKGFGTVSDGLAGMPAGSASGRECRKEAAAPEIGHLRDYSNYLAPLKGLLSADMWAMIGTWLRNLMLVLLLPRAFAVPMPWGWLKCLYPAVGLVGAAYGLLYIRLNLPSRTKGRHSLTQGCFIRNALFPLVAAGLAFAGAATQWAGALSLPPVETFGLWFAGILLFYGLIRLVEAFAGHAAGRKVGQIPLYCYALSAAVTALLMLGLGQLLQRLALLGPLHYALFAPAAVWLLFVLSETFFIGIASRFTDGEDREWWARAGAWLLIVVVVWCGGAALVFFGPQAIEAAGGALLQAIGLGAGGAVAWKASSSSTLANSEMVRKIVKRGLAAVTSDVLLALGAGIFIVVFLATLSMATDGLLQVLFDAVGMAPASGLYIQSDSAGATHTAIVAGTPWWALAAVAAALFLVYFGMGQLVDVNRFSLHAMYRNRLIRAYLGASRPPLTEPEPQCALRPTAEVDRACRHLRNPNRFTGFDPEDDLPLYRLNVFRPLLVVNTALNLVHGRRLAWQERKAESFTFSPLHGGNALLGYRPVESYGGGVSLGTAMAISGAAFTSNMGYHSSPTITFVMTLFNVRLGWWLGNPGRNSSWTRRGPEASSGVFVDEMLGLTDDGHPWVYLSDGGHFDNLGLYEMVARRCRYIVVGDASADPKFTFEDLGNAIRKVRVDMGIPIGLESGAHLNIGRGSHGQYCALFSVKYSAVDGGGSDGDGRMLYVKPALYRQDPGVPVDVCQYATTSKAFPHETTLDQFFGEAQFESYRALGEYELGQIMGECEGRSASLDELFGLARQHIDRRAAQTPTP